MDDFKTKLKTSLPSSLNRFVAQAYDNVSNYRFVWRYQKISRIVKNTSFNQKAVFPSDFEVRNSGLCRLLGCHSKDEFLALIGIAQINNRLTKMALREAYSFAKKGGKFICIPMRSGIPNKQQIKICSLAGYTTLKPANHLKQIPNIPLGITDFLPIGRFYPLPNIRKKYDFLIVTWAGDIRHKRWDIVVQLIKELCPNYKMCVLAYKGRPSKYDLNIINKFVKKRNLTFINKWVSKKDFPVLMNSSKVLIVPSEWDNHPRIMDQALLCNIPLVVNENLSGGKKLICERTGKLASSNNLAECSKRVLQNLAGKTETRSWYLQHFGPYNAARCYAAFINKVFGTNYRLVCMEGYEFMFTSKYMDSINGLPKDYKNLRIKESSNLKLEKLSPKRIPKISVIMSVFNEEEYLKESIESILSQTYKNFEFIIVDDGSIDRTPKILKDYIKKDPRIKIITNEKNIGLTKSLNKAIKIAQAEYIARQDADDISLPQRLEKQVEFLENYGEIKILGTFGYLIAQEAKILGKEIVPISPRAIKKTLIKRNPFIHSSIMLKKEIIDKIGGYNEKFTVIQDYELWFRILRIAKGENLPLFLVKKRYRPGMISFNRNKEQLKYMLFLQKEAIKRGDYSRFSYIYLLRTYLSSKCPLFFKIFLKRYFSKKRNVFKKIY